MEKEIVELYGDADMARLKRRITRWRVALWALAAAALAACVVMCALTGTANAARMETTVIVVSVLTGWIVIYGGVFVVSASRRELSHAEMLRSEERQKVTGTVTLTAERVAIRHSITARRVEVQGEGKPIQLLVCQTRAETLAAAGACAVYTAHGYVAAYEVTP